MGWRECEQIDLTTVTPLEAMEEVMAAIGALTAVTRQPSHHFHGRPERAILDLELAARMVAQTVIAAKHEGPRMSQFLHRQLLRDAIHVFDAIHEAHPDLGAPGDFGYDTPEGATIAWLYMTTRLLNAVLTPAPVIEPAQPVAALAAAESVEGT